MSRCYEFTFLAPSGRVVTAQGHGNTKKTALREARSRAGREHGEVELFNRVGRFVPREERTSS